MTMLMGDAVAELSPACLQAFRQGALLDVVYADDTILLGSIAEFVQEYAQAVQRAGAKYGLALHWGKAQAISIGGNRRMRKPDGSEFDDAAFLAYLGGLISRNGRADSEISTGIGRAYADFKKLRSLWSYACISLSEKSRNSIAWLFLVLHTGFARSGLSPHRDEGLMALWRGACEES